jgi:hypothetical protein
LGNIYLLHPSIKVDLRDPYSKAVEEYKLSTEKNWDEHNFNVHCNAGDPGHLAVSSSSLSVRIAQRILRDGRAGTWESVLVTCKEQADGMLFVEVVICHPDWDEPLRVASIRSNPKDRNTVGSVLECNLEQVPALRLNATS